MTLLPFSVASFNSPLGASRIFRTRGRISPRNLSISLCREKKRHSKLPREVRRDRLAPCCHVIRTLSVPAMVNHPSQKSPTENGKVTCRVNRGSARIFLRKEKKSRPHLAGRTRVRKVICRVMRRGDNPGSPGHAPGTCPYTRFRGDISACWATTPVRPANDPHRHRLSGVATPPVRREMTLPSLLSFPGRGRDTPGSPGNDLTVLRGARGSCNLLSSDI